MGTVANGVDQDEMQHYAAFHQGLHCLLRLRNLQGQKYIILKKILVLQCAVSHMLIVLICVAGLTACLACQLREFEYFKEQLQ